MKMASYRAIGPKTYEVRHAGEVIGYVGSFARHWVAATPDETEGTTNELSHFRAVRERLAYILLEKDRLFDTRAAAVNWLLAQRGLDAWGWV